MPGRLKVTGYGDQNFAADTEPPLTTIRIDGTKIGELAASVLIEKIEAGASKRAKVDVGFTLIERASAWGFNVLTHRAFSGARGTLTGPTAPIPSQC